MLYLSKRNTLFMALTTPYIINFNKKTGVFTLTSTKDEVKVDAKHKKYEWLKSQEAGRIVKISDKGRWNSSKDYIGLYDEINSSKSKKKSTVKSSVKTTKRKAKPVKDNSTELKELKTQLKELQTSNNKLKKEVSKRNKKIQLLENQITQLKKKTTTTRTTSNQNKKSMYGLKITALYSYHRRHLNVKETKPLNINIITDWLDKKPTQSLIKSYLKLAVNASNRGAFHDADYFNLPLRLVQGLNELKSSSLYHENKKISEITFISIVVRKTK